jgi:hypothetical protein
MARAVAERRTQATTRLWPPQRGQVRTSARNVLFKSSAHGTRDEEGGLGPWSTRHWGGQGVGAGEAGVCQARRSQRAGGLHGGWLIALGGEFGTLSEIALALKAGKPVVGLDTWELARREQPATEIVLASSPVEALERALALALRASSSARPGAPR